MSKDRDKDTKNLNSRRSRDLRRINVIAAMLIFVSNKSLQGMLVRWGRAREARRKFSFINKRGSLVPHALHHCYLSDKAERKGEGSDLMIFPIIEGDRTNE